MKTTTLAPNYRGYGFPPEITSHAMWLPFRHWLSFRDVEELWSRKREIMSGVEHRQHKELKQSSGKLTPIHTSA